MQHHLSIVQNLNKQFPQSDQILSGRTIKLTTKTLSIQDLLFLVKLWGHMHVHDIMVKRSGTGLTVLVTSVILNTKD